MVDKRRPPYFRVVFPGPVRTVTEETEREGRWQRRIYIDLGRYRLREVVTCPRMDCALDESCADSAPVVRLGHFLFWRWVLSVSCGGRIERSGLMPFILGLLAITAAFAVGGFVCLFIGIGVLEMAGGVSLALVLLLLWILHMAMNFKAWLGA